MLYEDSLGSSYGETPDLEKRFARKSLNRKSVTITSGRKLFKFDWKSVNINSGRKLFYGEFEMLLQKYWLKMWIFNSLYFKNLNIFWPSHRLLWT